MALKLAQLCKIVESSVQVSRNLPLLSNFRLSSYVSAPKVRPIEEYPEVEIVENPPEWKFVERLLPKTTIPKPVEKTEYPSGWRPPSALQNAKNLKYFVSRTKNHMVPVYLETRFRGQRQVTVVRRVQGDIWQLESDLRAVVEKARKGKLCASRVNEMSAQIHFHGDYVDVIREYFKSKGF